MGSIHRRSEWRIDGGISWYWLVFLRNGASYCLTLIASHVLTSEIDVATALQSITSVILTHYQPVKTLTRPVQDPGFNPALLQWQQRHQRQQKKAIQRIRHQIITIHRSAMLGMRSPCDTGQLGPQRSENENWNDMRWPREADASVSRASSDMGGPLTSMESQ